LGILAQGCDSWVRSIYVDSDCRHTQPENLPFSVDSSVVLLGLVIFSGLVRHFVGLVDLNFISHGAIEKWKYFSGPDYNISVLQ